LPNWGIFYQPFGGYYIFRSELLRNQIALPFDLAEGEAELVAGFHTEYGGFKMLMFFIGEYGHMMMASGLMIIFLLWRLRNSRGIQSEDVRQFGQVILIRFSCDNHIFTTASALSMFQYQVCFFLWIFIWVRWTLPRFRYDQLMDLGWKTMLPWALGKHNCDFNCYLLCGVF
jgi:NADH-quinone oxidoreductase subunit H